jgi:hypothetical protein
MVTVVKPFKESRGTLDVQMYDENYPEKFSIDPGECSGWAGWDAGNRLVGCGIGMHAWLKDAREVAVEMPQHYPQSPVPPQDLITLAFLAGRYIGTASKAEALHFYPHAWKGNLPKDVCGSRVLHRLSAAELSVVKEADHKVPKGLRNNMIDAIGIGLFAFRGLTKL